MTPNQINEVFKTFITGTDKFSEHMRMAFEESKIFHDDDESFTEKDLMNLWKKAFITFFNEIYTIEESPDDTDTPR